ncbi:hypothetical protein CLIB1423_10S00694 [[Candida] railenensis]|uniref:Zn(2)-C6 fungal-type domain-containing protein n=1 Tax=[Candida] railenensis TaxID=45579 RepID=A0A9P0QQT1_9ASCO|nr:hypothetical protein CLIB1423_10S00694 [[Candida] railenensis]
MDYYYRKSMGNGAITTKFRLNYASPFQQTSSNLRQGVEEAEVKGKAAEDSVPSGPSSTMDSESKVEKSAQPTSPSTAPKPAPEQIKESEDSSSVQATPLDTESSTKLVDPTTGTPATHHTSSCGRCYKLKKKCSREYPKCTNCTKSGVPCEYINRSNKRRKKLSVAENERLIGDINHKSFSKNGNGQKESEYFTEKEGAGSSLRTLLSEEQEKELAAHKLVSISSLLSNERSFDNNGRTAMIPKLPKTEATNITSSRGGGPPLRFADKLDLQAIKKPSHHTNLKDEFITMKPITDLDLPTRFIFNFFHNYETRCPFIDQNQFMQTFKELEFSKESIINLDVYLMLSIGCLIHDKSTNSSLFQEYFSEKNIESIVDVLNFESLEGLRLLFLLVLFKLNQYREESIDHCWELISILSRGIIKLNIYSGSENIEEQGLFWSVYNLDKTVSLLLKRPSQTPHDDFIGLPLPFAGNNEESSPSSVIDLNNKEIEYSMLINRLLALKLSKSPESKCQQIKELSSNIEKWRVGISRVIHSSNYEAPEEYISLVNLNYYYYLIELDQISLSESFQFTLQFLSNSFTLLMHYDEKNYNRKKNGGDRKKFIGFSLSTSFWYSKLFQVVKYSLNSLIDGLVTSDNAGDANAPLNLVEFNSNLQLMINLFKFLAKSDRGEMNYLNNKIDTFAAHLSLLGMKMMGFMMTDEAGKREQLAGEVKKINRTLFPDAFV